MAYESRQYSIQESYNITPLGAVLATTAILSLGYILVNCSGSSGGHFGIPKTTSTLDSHL